MTKYLFFILFLLTFFFVSGEVGANSGEVGANQNITSPEFKIDTGKIDPFNGGGSDPDKIGVKAATTLLGKIANLLLFLIPIIAGISFIIAGYYYILSSGDSEKATQAKTIIKWNLLAIAIAVFLYAIIYLIATLLDGPTP